MQDRNYRLVEYNQEFEDTFAPKPGDFCYYAYKGRTEKCENCPVEKTFLEELAQEGSQDMSGPQEAIKIIARGLLIPEAASK